VDPSLACTGDGGPAVLARLNGPTGVALDSNGNMFIADAGDNRIRQVASGTITTVAGRELTNTESGKDANGNPIKRAASNANLSAASAPYSASCALYNGIPVNNKSNPTSACALVGDGGSPLRALLAGPAAIVVDSSNDVIFTDSKDHRVRLIAAGLGNITTVAGNGTSCAGTSCGDGSGAPSAQLNGPTGLSIDSSGNLTITDTGDSRIRLVNTGVIQSVTGFNSFNGDQTALSTKFLNPDGIASDAAGNLYVSDTGNNRVRKIDTAGNVTTIVGSGTDATDETISALAAKLSAPTGLAVSPDGGTLYVTDSGNNRIRKVVGGIINTVVIGLSAGIGTTVTQPGRKIAALALDGAGNLYFTDVGNNAIYSLSADGTTLTLLAGQPGTSGAGGDGGSALNALFNAPSGIAVTQDGSQIFVADTSNFAVRVLKRDPVSNTLFVYPLVGDYGNNNAAPPATPSYTNSIRASKGLALNAAQDTLFIADTFGNQIRTVNISTLVETAIAGEHSTAAAGAAPNYNANNDNPGDFAPVFAGDGISALDTTVRLSFPEALTVDSNGNVFFADTANSLIRELAVPAASH